MKRLSILLAAMLLIASAGQAETLEPVVTPAAELTEALETTIRATGTESVPLPADIVVLTLCVQGSGDNVTTAQDKAEQVMQSLRDALTLVAMTVDSSLCTSVTLTSWSSWRPDASASTFACAMASAVAASSAWK